MLGVFFQDLEALDVATANGEEDAAETLVMPLLIYLDLLLPYIGLVCFANECFRLLFFFLQCIVFWLLRLL